MKLKLGERMMIAVFFRTMGAVPRKDVIAYLNVMKTIEETEIPVKAEITQEQADAEIEVEMSSGIRKWLADIITLWHRDHPIPTVGGSWYAVYMISLLTKLLEGGE